MVQYWDSQTWLVEVVSVCSGKHEDAGLEINLEQKSGLEDDRRL
jgi:hypothetical protein